MCECGKGSGPCSWHTGNQGVMSGRLLFPTFVYATLGSLMQAPAFYVRVRGPHRTKGTEL